LVNFGAVTLETTFLICVPLCGYLAKIAFYEQDDEPAETLITQAITQAHVTQKRYVCHKYQTYYCSLIATTYVV